MKLKEALQKSKVGQYVKAIGDSFRGNAGYYFKDQDGFFYWTNGAAGCRITDKFIDRISDDIPDITYGIYSSTNDYSLVED